MIKKLGRQNMLIRNIVDTIKHKKYRDVLFGKTSMSYFDDKHYIPDDGADQNKLRLNRVKIGSN